LTWAMPKLANRATEESWDVFILNRQEFENRC
jgi:hypothetical protein